MNVAEYVPSYHDLRAGDVILCYGGLGRVTRTTASTVWFSPLPEGDIVTIQMTEFNPNRMVTVRTFINRREEELRLFKQDFYKVRVSGQFRDNPVFYVSGTFIYASLPVLERKFEQPSNA